LSLYKKANLSRMETDLMISCIRWRRWFFTRNRHFEFWQFHVRPTFEPEHHVSYEWHFAIILFPTEKSKGSLLRRWTRKKKSIHRYANEKMTLSNHSENSRFLFPSRHCPYSEHHRYILSKKLDWSASKKKKVFTSIDHVRFEFSLAIGRTRKWFEKLDRNWLYFEKI
jgi:hypothetical protein